MLSLHDALPISNTVGTISGWALLAIGLMNSIMFPTIFTLASAGLGKRAAEGSGVICMAIVGGAIIPPLTGQMADISGLRASLLIPRSEEHTSELQSLMRISYAVFCLKKKK